MMIYHRPHLYLTKPKSSNGSAGDTFHLHVAIALQDGEDIAVFDPTVDSKLRQYKLEIKSGSNQPKRTWSGTFSFPDPNYRHDCEIHVILDRKEDGFFVNKGTGKTLHSNADDKPFSETE